MSGPGVNTVLSGAGSVSVCPSITCRLMEKRNFVGWYSWRQCRRLFATGIQTTNDRYLGDNRGT